MKHLFRTLFIAAAVSSLAAIALAQPANITPRQETLLNGLNLYAWSDPSATNVTVVVRLHSGASFDPRGKEGVMRMLAENLFPTQTLRDYFVEDLEGSIAVTTTYDAIEIRAVSSPDNFLKMLEAVASAISNPTIDKDTTAKLVASQLDEIAKSSGDPAYVADRAAAERLFGIFPYGRPILGTKATVEKIRYPDLIDAQKRFLTADNASVAVYGKFDRDLGYRAVRRYFGAWLKSDSRVPTAFRQAEPPDSAPLFIASPGPDGALRIAFRGVSRDSKQFAAAEVFCRALEKRLQGRLPAAVSSGVFVRNEAHILPGQITVGIKGNGPEFGAANGKIDVVELMIKAIGEPFTDAEFTAARTAAASAFASYPLADEYLDVDTFKTSVGGDRKAIAALKATDVNAFASTVMSAPRAVAVVTSGASK